MTTGPAPGRRSLTAAAFAAATVLALAATVAVAGTVPASGEDVSPSPPSTSSSTGSAITSDPATALTTSAPPASAPEVDPSSSTAPDPSSTPPSVTPTPSDTPSTTPTAVASPAARSSAPPATGGARGQLKDGSAPAAAIGSAAVAVTSPVSASSVGFDLSAGSTTFAGFTFVGLVTVSTPTGDVSAMDLTATHASLVDLGLVVPCTAVASVGTGMTSVTSTKPGGTSTAAQGLELYLTTLTVTVSGSPTTFTPASPPPSLGDVTVDSLDAHGLWASMPSLSAPGLAQHTAFCKP